jgi:hypothetical protein
MKAWTLLPLLYIRSAFAAPASDAQIVLGEAAALVDTLREGFVSTVENDVATAIHNVEYGDKVETWFENSKEFVKQNGLVCTSLHRSGMPSAQLARP